MQTALQLAEGSDRLTATVITCQKLLPRRSLVAAAASVVPPGLDWAVDAALMSRLIPEINARFGLTPAQIGRLEPRQRKQVQKAAAMVGSALIGKLISKEVVLRLARKVGLFSSASSG